VDDLVFYNYISSKQLIYHSNISLWTELRLSFRVINLAVTPASRPFQSITSKTPSSMLVQDIQQSNKQILWSVQTKETSGQQTRRAQPTHRPRYPFLRSFRNCAMARVSSLQRKCVHVRCQSSIDMRLENQTLKCRIADWKERCGDRESMGRSIYMEFSTCPPPRISRILFETAEGYPLPSISWTTTWALGLSSTARKALVMAS